MSASDWRENRAATAAAHREALEQRKAAESARASAMIREVVTQALQAGLQPEPLVARSYSGRAVYKTNLVGWYLRSNKTVGVDTEGNFYLLSVEGSLKARFAGVSVEPSPPPLILGYGARDGESMDLSQALALILEKGHI